MFDIGFTELLLVAVVALLVLGPEKLPSAVRVCGMWVGKVKRTVSNIQSEISEELRLEEMRRTIESEKAEWDSSLDDMHAPFADAMESVSSSATTDANSSVLNTEIPASGKLDSVNNIEKSGQ